MLRLPPRPTLLPYPPLFRSPRPFKSDSPNAVAAPEAQSKTSATPRLRGETPFVANRRFDTSLLFWSNLRHLTPRGYSSIATSLCSATPKSTPHPPQPPPTPL